MQPKCPGVAIRISPEYQMGSTHTDEEIAGLRGNCNYRWRTDVDSGKVLEFINRDVG